MDAEDIFLLSYPLTFWGISRLCNGSLDHYCGTELLEAQIFASSLLTTYIFALVISIMRGSSELFFRVGLNAMILITALWII